MMMAFFHTRLPGLWRLFERFDVEAVSAARAHYFWPDLKSLRAGCGLIPREHGRLRLGSSRALLRHLLKDNDYYKLPCVYHGFVAKTAIDRYASRMGRFLLSGIPDAASTFALCLEDIRFALIARAVDHRRRIGPQ